jgi:hypothetical protein
MDQVTPSSSPRSLSSDGDFGLLATAATSIVDLSANMSKIENGETPPQVSRLDIELQDMYSENSAAKIWRVAEEYLGPNVSLGFFFYRWPRAATTNEITYRINQRAFQSGFPRTAKTLVDM